MTPHRLQDIPVWPRHARVNEWETTCKCGWGEIGDSPEAVVIAAAQHLPEGESNAERS